MASQPACTRSHHTTILDSAKALSDKQLDLKLEELQEQLQEERPLPASGAQGTQTCCCVWEP